MPKVITRETIDKIVKNIANIISNTKSTYVSLEQIYLLFEEGIYRLHKFINGTDPLSKNIKQEFSQDIDNTSREVQNLRVGIFQLCDKVNLEQKLFLVLSDSYHPSWLPSKILDVLNVISQVRPAILDMIFQIFTTEENKERSILVQKLLGDRFINPENYNIELCQTRAFISQRNSELPEAMRIGDREKAKEILQDPKYYIDSLNEEGKAALHIAAEKGDIEMTEILLQYRAYADIRIYDKIWQKMPLHLALINGNSEVAKLLIEAGADVNSKFAYPYIYDSDLFSHHPRYCETEEVTPCLWHALSVYYTLKKSGSLAKYKDKGDKYIQMLHMLMDSGVEVGWRMNGSVHAHHDIHLATLANLPEITEKMIKTHPTLVNAICKNKTIVWIPLEIATRNCNFELTIILLKNKANPFTNLDSEATQPILANVERWGNEEIEEKVKEREKEIFDVIELATVIVGKGIASIALAEIRNFISELEILGESIGGAIDYFQDQGSFEYEENILEIIEKANRIAKKFMWDTNLTCEEMVDVSQTKIIEKPQTSTVQSPGIITQDSQVMDIIPSLNNINILGNISDSNVDME